MMQVRTQLCFVILMAFAGLAPAADQHRENNKQPHPHGIKTIPHLMKEAGYFAAFVSYKTDCNFTPDTKEELFEGTA